MYYVDMDYTDSMKEIPSHVFDELTINAFDWLLEAPGWRFLVIFYKLTVILSWSCTPKNQHNCDHLCNVIEEP